MIGNASSCPSIANLDLLRFLLMKLDEGDEFGLIRHELDVFVLELLQWWLKRMSADSVLVRVILTSCACSCCSSTFRF